MGRRIPVARGCDELERLFEGSDIRGCEILDIGCGLGAIDELLVTRFGAGTVVGVDIDPALVEECSQRVKRAGLSDRNSRDEGGRRHAAVRRGEIRRGVSKDSMVQIPDKPKIYADVLRVLRPGAGSSRATGCGAARQATPRK